MNLVQWYGFCAIYTTWKWFTAYLPFEASAAAGLVPSLGFDRIATGKHGGGQPDGLLLHGQVTDLTGISAGNSVQKTKGHGHDRKGYQQLEQ
jgi:hypothetical protein